MTQNSKAADDLPITKLLSPLPATLKTLFESSNRPLVRGGASAALLTCFHGVNDPHAYDLADTSISRKNLLAIWQAGKRFYREGLTEANFTTDWQGRLAAVSSWTKFMKRHILLAAKGTRAERESQGSKEVEEEAEALQRVVKDLIADLKERLREKQSPLFAFNAICALAGVGIASSQLLQSKGFSEAIWDYLMELNKSESLSSEENVAQLLALAHILEGQSGTDIQRIEKTLATLKSAFAKHLRDDDWVSWAAVVGMGILTEASSHDMGRGEVEQAKWNLLLSSVDFIESVTVSQPSPRKFMLLFVIVVLLFIHSFFNFWLISPPRSPGIVCGPGLDHSRSGQGRARGPSRQGPWFPRSCSAGLFFLGNGETKALPSLPGPKCPPPWICNLDPLGHQGLDAGAGPLSPSKPPFRVPAIGEESASLGDRPDNRHIRADPHLRRRRVIIP